MKFPENIATQVKLALAEDIGTGDVTADLIPAENLVELKYENLISDPVSGFERLQQGIFSDMEVDQRVFDFMIHSHGKHNGNIYSFEKKYIDRVNRELGSLIEKQGYPVL